MNKQLILHTTMINIQNKKYSAGRFINFFASSVRSLKLDIKITGWKSLVLHKKYLRCQIYDLWILIC